MSQPEFILAESEKTRRMESQLLCLDHTLLAVEVDLVVLSKEVSKLHQFLENTIEQVRELRQLELEQG